MSRLMPLLRGSLGAAVAAIGVVVTLGAQAPTTDKGVPIPSPSVRLPKVEAQLGGGEGAGALSVRVYRSEAPLEMLFRWYQRSLLATRDIELDSASMEPGDVTRVGYHLFYHAIKDECADSAAAAPAPSQAPPTCKVWRLGKDKERSLHNRMGLAPDEWIERATFTWFGRALNGVWTRWQLELQDTGLSKDWKRYELKSQIIVRKVVYGAPGP
jgi:hypothetical protein